MMFGRNAPVYAGADIPDQFGNKPVPWPGQDQSQQMQPQGGGYNLGGRIQQFINTLAANHGIEGGVLALQQEAQRRQEQMRIQQQMTERKQNNEDLLSRFIAEQTWRQQNPPPPEPTNVERAMAAAHIDPNSPEGQQMLRNAANNAANPIQGVPYTDAQGHQGIQFIRPQMGGPPPPPLSDADIAAHRSQGGAGQPQAQGTFPRQDGGAFDFRTHPANR